MRQIQKSTIVFVAYDTKNVSNFEIFANEKDAHEFIGLHPDFKHYRVINKKLRDFVGEDF